ncbi:class I SAM-dependent methyltransferase, partial [Chlamydiales bacterium]|nr:class I SAM-dependent methyltransferase [Chlamydiales bacterium]
MNRVFFLVSVFVVPFFIEGEIWELSPDKINEWQFLDAEGKVFPWYTKSFLDELVTWDISDWEILEMGSGYSTAWLATHCKNLVSVENDVQWAEAVQKDLKHQKIKNVQFKVRDDALTREVNGVMSSHFVEAMDEDDKLYDCIVVDGADVTCRNQCVYKALNHIKLGGVIILDNANQATCGIDSTPAFQLLSGYKHYSFKQPNHPDWRTDYWVIEKNTCSSMELEGEAAPLIIATLHTTGPILELGSNSLITPLLHGLCSKDRRFVVTSDSNLSRLDSFKNLKSSWHHFQYVPTSDIHWSKNPDMGLWNSVGKQLYWGVVYLDCHSIDQDAVNIQSFKDKADLIVIHNSQEKGAFKDIEKEFEYFYHFNCDGIQTTLLSDQL